MAAADGLIVCAKSKQQQQQQQQQTTTATTILKTLIGNCFCFLYFAVQMELFQHCNLSKTINKLKETRSLN